MQTTLIPGDRLAQRGSGWLQGLVRLAPGASMAEAQPGLDVAADAAGRRLPRDQRGTRAAPLSPLAAALGRHQHAAAGHGRARRPGRAAPRGGLRQHGQPAAGPRQRPPARTGGAPLARRDPRPDRAAAHRRNGAPRARRRPPRQCRRAVERRAAARVHAADADSGRDRRRPQAGGAPLRHRGERRGRAAPGHRAWTARLAHRRADAAQGLDRAATAASGGADGCARG